MTTLQTTSSQAVAPADVSMAALESALAGDLKRLTTEDRLKYVSRACELVGLNPLTKPFDFIELNGKLVMYANKSCAEQLRKLHGVSVDIVERKVEFGCLIVRTRATDRDGRHDEALAAVPFNEKNPELAANAMMKAETKAKRRVTFSICGLGFAADYDGEPNQQPAEAVTTETSTTSLAAKLNQQLTEGEKLQAIPVASSPTPVAESVPVKSAAVDVEVVSAAAPVATPATAATVLGVLPDATVEQLQTVLSEHGPQKQAQAIEYIISKGKLKKGEGLEKLPPDIAAYILKDPKRYFVQVDKWVAQFKPVA